MFGVPPQGLAYYSIYEDLRWWYNPSWYSGFCMTSWIPTRRYYNNEEEVFEEEEEELYGDGELYESDEEDEELYEDEEEEEEEESYSSSNYTNWWRSNNSYESYDPVEASHRETLGLSPWAPLKIEDVKHAYRNCALKWHPDRHDDSTKDEAEAKFKFCNVAYQSLIQKLQ
ncbi:hypothetical protein N665_0354s0047 [Sinapis alba]|nr:hypothetical protein N665_0354s0047 [Sinapis alba]